VLALLCGNDRLLFAIQPQVLEPAREGGHVGYAVRLKSKSKVVLQLSELTSVVLQRDPLLDRLGLLRRQSRLPGPLAGGPGTRALWMLRKDGTLCV
jgi:hypothetical protein